MRQRVSCETCGEIPGGPGGVTGGNLGELAKASTLDSLLFSESIQRSPRKFRSKHSHTRPREGLAGPPRARSSCARGTATPAGRSITRPRHALASAKSEEHVGVCYGLRSGISLKNPSRRHTPGRKRSGAEERPVTRARRLGSPPHTAGRVNHNTPLSEKSVL